MSQASSSFGTLQRASSSPSLKGGARRSKTPPPANRSRPQPKLPERKTAEAPQPLKEEPKPAASPPKPMSVSEAEKRYCSELADRLYVERLFVEREEAHGRFSLQHQREHAIAELAALRRHGHRELFMEQRHRAEIMALRRHLEDQAGLAPLREELKAAQAQTEEQQRMLQLTQDDIQRREAERRALLEDERRAWEQQRAALVERIRCLRERLGDPVDPTLPDPVSTTLHTTGTEDPPRSISQPSNASAPAPAAATPPAAERTPSRDPSSNRFSSNESTNMASRDAWINSILERTGGQVQAKPRLTPPRDATPPRREFISDVPRASPWGSEAVERLSAETRMARSIASSVLDSRGSPEPAESRPRPPQQHVSAAAESPPLSSKMAPSTVRTEGSNATTPMPSEKSTPLVEPVAAPPAAVSPGGANIPRRKGIADVVARTNAALARAEAALKATN